MANYIEQIKKSRGRWFIPILSIFFIEELCGWVLDSKDNEKYYRYVILILMCFIHIITIVLTIFFMGFRS